jgi:hypothetical protein
MRRAVAALCACLLTAPAFAQSISGPGIATPVTVANGGTGSATLTSHSVVVGAGTSAVTLVAPSSTTGYVLTSNGASADPSFQAATGGATLGANTFTGLQTMAAATTAGAGLNLPQGTAPTSPNNGDFWTTSAGAYVRINGTTVGPLVASGTGSPTNLNLGAYASATAVQFAVGSTFTATGAYSYGFTIPGAYTYTFPANTGTLAQLNLAQSFSNAQTFSTAIAVSGTAAIQFQGVKVLQNTVPTITATSCGGASATTSITHAAGSVAFDYTVSGTISASTCTVALPAATNGWACDAHDTTTNSEVVEEASFTTAQVVFNYYARTTGLGTNPTTGDVVVVKCAAF